jgi:myo-inositol-1(or 4)-monophosphatase
VSPVPPGPWLADLELAWAAAAAAGDLAMRAFGSDHVIRHKAADQPVTATDTAVDLLLRDLLQSARPEYGWLSEETADAPDRLRQHRVWIVDPIDGTRAYIDGEAEFSISIGLAEAGVPQVGVVHAPALGETYWAVRGAGAWRGPVGASVRLGVRAWSAGERATVLASRTDRRSGRLSGVEAVASVRATGSTAYKIARVAAGLEHGYATPAQRSEWDVCAAALLIEEAGGVITDGAGRPLDFNRPAPHHTGIVAAGSGFHPTLLDALGAGAAG